MRRAQQSLLPFTLLDVVDDVVVDHNEIKLHFITNCDRRIANFWRSTNKFVFRCVSSNDYEKSLEILLGKLLFFTEKTFSFLVREEKYLKMEAKKSTF